MKVVLKTGDRVELRGIPQGRSLPFGFLVCTGIGIVAGIFTYIQWTNSKSIWPAVPPAVGVVFMTFMMTVLGFHAFKRERLVLDKVTRTAEYETWSLLVGSRKKVTYPFDRIHGVAVQKSLQSPGGGKGFPVEVTTARLLISRPRRAIDLDEAQGGSAKGIETLAGELAEFLGVAITPLGSHEEAPRRKRRRVPSRD